MPVTAIANAAANNDANNGENSKQYLQMFGCYSYYYDEITELQSPLEITCITETEVHIDLTTCLTIITPLMYVCTPSIHL